VRRADPGDAAADHGDIELEAVLERGVCRRRRRGQPEGICMSRHDGALKDADITSGTAEGTPVHAPTIPDDEGNPGDGTGEGNEGPASGGASENPAAPEVDHL